MTTATNGASTVRDLWRNWIEIQARAEGQGLVEYAMIILLVAIAAIGALGVFGGGVNGLYAQIVAKLPF